MMYCIGLPIGFYAYLFPGNINLMVLELYRSRRFKFLSVALGLIVVFESLYCAVSLLLLYTLNADSAIYKGLEVAAYLLLLAMGVWMLAENKQKVAQSQKNTVYRGVLSVLVHPQQIPFWVLTGVLVNEVAPLGTSQRALLQFTIFNALGTLLAMLFYMVFGTKLLNYLNLNIAQINKVMGALYLLLALWGLFFG